MERVVFDVRGCGLGDVVCALWIAEGARGTVDVAFNAGDRTNVRDLLRLFGRETTDEAPTVGFGSGTATYQGELSLRGEHPRPPRPVLWQRWMPFKVQPQRPTATIAEEAARFAGEKHAWAGGVDRPLALLFPYSKRAGQNWPYQKWHRLAYTLESRGWATIALHWSKDGIETLPHWLYGPSIETLAALMRRATCVVSNDSGPAHLAGTLGTKTFALMGAADPVTVFGYCEDVEPIRVSAETVPCVGCHFEYDRGFWKACDSGCEALQALTWWEVLERVEGWRASGDPVGHAVAVAHSIEGMMTRTELAHLARFCLERDVRTVLEIGSWRGRSATLFAEMGATVYCVEDFLGRWARDPSPVPTDEAHATRSRFLRNMGPYLQDGRCVLLETDSVTRRADLCRQLREAEPGGFDLVFIDGSHDAESVESDVALARSVLDHDGGLITGHDANMCSVVEGVERHTRDWSPAPARVTRENKLWWWEPGPDLCWRPDELGEPAHVG